MRWLLVALAGCASEPEVAFGFAGVVNGQIETGSTIGLWNVHQPAARTFKFGDGTSSLTEFGISFRLDPPAGAIDADGIGVALIGLLPGVATAPDGDVDPSMLQLIGMSISSAAIFKAPGATGPAWADDFPDGFACGVCDRNVQPNTFQPADCTFVTIERVFDNPCVW